MFALVVKIREERRRKNLRRRLAIINIFFFVFSTYTLPSYYKRQWDREPESRDRNRLDQNIFLFSNMFGRLSFELAIINKLLSILCVSPYYWKWIKLNRVYRRRCVWEREWVDPRKSKHEHTLCDKIFDWNRILCQHLRESNKRHSSKCNRANQHTQVDLINIYWISLNWFNTLSDKKKQNKHLLSVKTREKEKRNAHWKDRIPQKIQRLNLNSRKTYVLLESMLFFFIRVFLWMNESFGLNPRDT